MLLIGFLTRGFPLQQLVCLSNDPNECGFLLLALLRCDILVGVWVRLVQAIQRLLDRLELICHF